MGQNLTETMAKSEQKYGKIWSLSILILFFHLLTQTVYALVSIADRIISYPLIHFGCKIKPTLSPAQSYL